MKAQIRWGSVQARKHLPTVEQTRKQREEKIKGRRRFLRVEQSDSNMGNWVPITNITKTEQKHALLIEFPAQRQNREYPQSFQSELRTNHLKRIGN